jgi:hypothetical protein
MMTDRIEEYRLADGSWTTKRSGAILARPDDIVQSVRAVGTVIAEQYFLGTAKHEANFATNERDMEAPDPLGVRFTSWGIYQLSTEEARQVGRPNADLLSLQESTWILAKLTEMRRVAIRAQCHLDPLAPDPIGLEAYLAIAHNQGLRAALTTIKEHRLDWRAYKARNPTIRIVSSGYGDDVLPRSL